MYSKYVSTQFIPDYLTLPAVLAAAFKTSKLLIKLVCVLLDSYISGSQEQCAWDVMIMQPSAHLAHTHTMIYSACIHYTYVA